MKGSMELRGWESTQGSKSRTSKISEPVARLIKFGEADPRKVAKAVGVSVSLVRNIRAGRAWRHLER